MAAPNEMYAVDPKVIESYRDLIAILREFGFYKARFIAILPNKWKQDVIKRISDIYSNSPSDKTQYVEKTRRKLGRFTDRDEKIEQLRLISVDKARDMNAHENVYLHAFKNHIVDKCITADGANETICFRDYLDGDIELELMNSDNIRDVTTEISVKRQLKLFMPLIEFNDEITIIDPNMKFTTYKNDPHMMLIEKIIEAMTNTINPSSKSKTLYLYYKSDAYNGRLDVESEKKQWFDLYSQEINKGMIIKLFPMAETSEQDLHDRWVLGHRAGGWMPPRGPKAQKKSEELNYTSMTNNYVFERLSDYKLENNRIKLAPGLDGPIKISAEK